MNKNFTIGHLTVECDGGFETVVYWNNNPIGGDFDEVGTLTIDLTDEQVEDNEIDRDVFNHLDEIRQGLEANGWRVTVNTGPDQGLIES